MIVAVTGVRQLLQCSPDSVIETLMRLSGNSNDVMVFEISIHKIDPLRLNAYRQQF